MLPLSIALKKKKDGTCVLACTRPDGSSTWQRYDHAFFPLHDLMHYAVETTLGLRYGFYGLLADGWNITDFGERSLPEHAQTDAALAEAVVGLFDQERGTGIIPDANAFNEALRAVLDQMRQPRHRPLSADVLDAIRTRFRNLAGRWARTVPGDAMPLTFDVAPAPPA